MTSTYTLHMPADAEPGDSEALENAELVKDGFSPGAFVFTFLWFFWNRLWLAGLAVMVVVLGLAFALPALRVGMGAAFLAELLLALLIGLEANSLKRWTWQRRKPIVDMVTASDLEEAEAKAVSRWLAGNAGHRAPRVPASFVAGPYRRPEPVIGLFPDMERSR